MGKETKIGWTQKTWNIARGCSKVDSDCLNCYMYRESMVGTRYNPKQVIRTKTVFDLPLKIKEPSLIFMSSLTDVLHEDIDEYRFEAFDIIRRCPQHTFQVLTKRPERVKEALFLAYQQACDLSSNNSSMLSLAQWLWEWKNGNAPSNVWLGTSVGSPKGRNRIIDLLEVPAKTRFVSLEPLHEAVDLERIVTYEGSGCSYRTNALTGRTWEWDANGKNGIYDHGYTDGNKLDWVIVGGESGNEHGSYRYRPCKVEWLQTIVQQCQKTNVPVFVKQLGTHLAKQLNLKHRHGADPNEWPEDIDLNIQQFPQ